MRKRTLFAESALDNNATYLTYYQRLLELSISMFEWKNLPPTIDSRYIELMLFEKGSVVYFDDEAIGNLCLDCISQGQFDVYGYPKNRRAYSSYNQYSRELNEKNSVIIWNNFLRTNSQLVVRMYAKRLYNIDRVIDINVNSQKTPVAILASPQQRLTMKNLYKEYDGNAPFIFGDKNLDLNGIKAISTGAPYVADSLYALKTQIWNEALTYLGISNVNTVKKERLISDEVQRNLGGTIASRYSRLQSRKDAVQKINKMFNTNIEVEYRDDVYSDLSDDIRDGEDNE